MICDAVKKLWVLDASGGILEGMLGMGVTMIPNKNIMQVGGNSFSVPFSPVHSATLFHIGVRSTQLIDSTLNDHQYISFVKANTFMEWLNNACKHFIHSL